MERVKFNVGGKLFECYTKTLRRFPKSKLARVESNHDSFCVERGEYFFDRNPKIFEAILEACRTGELHIPRDTCHSSVKRELDFWEISPGYLSSCCWKKFYRADNDKRTIKRLTEFYRRNTNLYLRGSTASIRSRLWMFLDDPRSSKYAKIWAAFMAFVVIICMFTMSWATTGHSKVDTRTKAQKETLDFYFAFYGYVNGTDSDVADEYMRTHPWVDITMITCFVFITLEIFLRMVCCPNLCRYLKSPVHICEIIGAVSFWLNIYTEMYLENFKSIAGFIFVMVFRYLIILQVFRLERIARHSMAFNIMSISVKSSLPEIGVLFALLLLLVTLFGWLMYAVEYENKNFDNCFSGMYWALITLTTVGYGDYYPKTIIGHVFAGACAVCGVVTLAMPIGVIAASFNSYYSYHKDVSNHLKEHKPQELEE